MRQFMIKYRFSQGPESEWHDEIRKFIAGIDGDPALTGKISYRCMKSGKGPDYFHIATVKDQAAVDALQQQAFFKSYSERTKAISGGSIEVVPLELIAETKPLV